jgi:predicted dehydrogenase
MSNNRIRVGIVGLNTGRGWASTAHVPALKALASDYELVAVANSRLASAQQAAAAFGIAHAFGSVEELAACSEVDLVVITVKVPQHLQLAQAALDAGKHIYCEWPLGNGLAQARELAELAQRKGVVAVVGTQARLAPEVAHLRELIAGGFVGEVLSTTLVGSGWAWGPIADASHTYLYDLKNGATLLTIPLGHTLAAFGDVLGPIADVSARLMVRRDRIKLISATETIYDTARQRVSADQGRPDAVAGSESFLKATAPDQVLVHGRLKRGAAYSIHYRGGLCRGTNLLWEINGSDGDIQVLGDMGHTQMVQLRILGACGAGKELRPLGAPAPARPGMPKESIPRNVALVYERLAADIRAGTRTAPTFQDAVALHELIDRIEQSDREARKIDC